MSSEESRFVWVDGEWKCVKPGALSVNLLELVPSRQDNSVIARARVLYDFEPMRNDELAINYGDEVEIITKERNGWWLVRKEVPYSVHRRDSYETGLIPSNYVVEIPNDSPPPPPSSASEDHPESTIFDQTESTVDTNKAVVHKKPPAFLPPPVPSASASSPANSSAIHSNPRFESLLKELETWEKLEQSYQSAVTPILQEYKSTFEMITNSYLEKLRSALPQFSSTPLIDNSKLILQEFSNFQQAQNSLFGDGNSLLASISKEIHDRKHIVQLRQSVILIQSVYRGHLARKKYRKKLRERKKRSQICKEILTNETNYLSVLRFLQDDCHRRLEDLNYQSLQAQQPPICPPQLIPRMFSNIEDLIRVHHALLQDLQQALAPSTWDPLQSLLGTVFLKHIPALLVYIPFIQNFEDAVAALKEAEQGKDFQRFLLVLKANPKSGNQLLSSLLLTPVSRLPRIELLLAELIKNTPSTHPDHPVLVRARNNLKEVTVKVNEHKRKHDEQQQVARLAQLFDPPLNLVTPTRELVHQGPLTTDSMTLISASASRIQYAEVHLFLFNDALLIASSRGKKLRLCELIALHRLKVKAFANPAHQPSFCFTLQVANRRPDKFFVATQAELEKWISIINESKLLAGESHVAQPPLLAHATSPFNSSTSPTSPVHTPSTSSIDPPPSTSTDSHPSPPVHPSDPSITTALALFQQIFSLQAELFQYPIQIQTLFPSLQQQMSQDGLNQLRSRIGLLQNILDQIEGARRQLVELFKKEQALLVLDATIQNGNAPIESMKNMIQQLYPFNPQVEHPMRTALRQLILWFQSLMVSWNQIKQL